MRKSGSKQTRALLISYVMKATSESEKKIFDATYVSKKSTNLINALTNTDSFYLKQKRFRHITERWKQVQLNYV